MDAGSLCLAAALLLGITVGAMLVNLFTMAETNRHLRHLHSPLAHQHTMALTVAAIGFVLTASALILSLLMVLQSH